MIYMLEFKNSFLFFLSISITLSFSRMLYTDRENWAQAYYGAMIGVVTFFTGFTAYQALYWAWRHYGDGGNLTWLGPWRVFAMLAVGALMAIGAACIIRNFTVARFGHRLWVMVLGLSAVAAALLTFVLPRDGVDWLL